MLVVAALLAYASLLGGLGDRQLAGARWATRSPRTALRVWHACALTFLGTVAAALVLAAHDVWEHAVVWLFHADKHQVHAVYAGSWHFDVVADAALILLLAGAGTVAALAARRIRNVRREQSRMRLVTDALATPGRGALSGVRVLEHSAPAAFCVPGRGTAARIVLTRGALTGLSDDEVTAAVEHERAHLLFRHHRMIVLADVVTAAVGWSGALANYAHQVQRLSEMAADDHAARRHGHRTVASALLEMCTVPDAGGAHGAVLGMTGPDPGERIRRLLAARPAHTGRTLPLLATGAIATLLVVPSVMSLGPAITVANTAHCPPHCHD